MIEFLEAREERYSIIVVLQTTSPFRTVAQIDTALERLLEEGLDSVISVVEERAATWRLVEDRLEPLFGVAGRRGRLRLRCRGGQRAEKKAEEHTDNR